MSCSALYGSNTQSQTVAVNGIVNFGNIVRRYGQNLAMTNGNVNLIGKGYYKVDANINVGGTGAITVQLYKDGVAIAGATATVTTAADSPAQICIPCIVKNTCCYESTLTAIVTGVAATISSASVSVEKL